GNYLPAINDYDYSLGNELFSFNDNGLARNLGLEIMIDKSFSNGFNININTSLFKSEFRNSEGQWYDSRYSFGRIINLNLSKRLKLKKENILFINLAMHERGGTYGNSYILVNLEEPKRLKHFFRTDLRIQYNWKRKNVFIMDIQNVLNTRNESHVYYDPFSDQLVTKLNLGMIPVLSYRRILGNPF
ncbi:MAG: TonB-dependent receptor, partial [Bacteroidia bacterium]|nr:TonB-dependent receptor [Bacteroidia bacterium]